MYFLQKNFLHFCNFFVTCPSYKTVSAMKEHNFRTEVLPLSDKLFRLALRITMVREDAEDMVQEALLRVWRTMQQGDEIDNVEAFAVTTCRNLCLDLIERQQHHDITFDPAQHESLSSDPTPDEQMEADEKYESISRLINQLPEKQKTAIQLRDIEGHSYRDIAQIMNISESDVKVNIHRARQTIKNILKPLNP
jgi:RNA polymerase sigma-70 factor (ECF subfamily)